MTISHVWEIARSNRQEVKRFVKFAIVGAAGSITDFTVLNLLIQVGGLSLVSANAYSFTAAVLQNFMLNRRWTFPESRERHASGQLLRFVVVSLIGLGLNQLVFLTIHHLLEAHWIATLGANIGFIVSYNFAKIFAIGVVLFWNFTVNRLWTYRGL